MRTPAGGRSVATGSHANGGPPHVPHQPQRGAVSYPRPDSRAQRVAKCRPAGLDAMADIPRSGASDACVGVRRLCVGARRGGGDRSGSRRPPTRPRGLGDETMELRHLRYFVAIAEERSFTRAAERLWVAQPGLSTQIRQLETELGVRLFERHTRGVDLTDAGEVLLGRARAALAAADAAADTGRDLEAG